MFVISMIVCNYFLDVVCNVTSVVTCWFEVFVQGFEGVLARMENKEKYTKMKILLLHSSKAIVYFPKKAPNMHSFFPTRERFFGGGSEIAVSSILILENNGPQVMMVVWGQWHI